MNTPESTPEPKLGWRAGRWLTLSAFVLVADQLTKLAVLDNFELLQRVSVLPFFDLIRLHNPGAAFSFLADESGWQNDLFIVIALVASIALLLWLLTLPRYGHRTLAGGLSLVLGGALGNLADRLNHGYVVDFLLFYWPDVFVFPAFNVADSAITCGVVLILFDSLVLERRRA